MNLRVLDWIVCPVCGTDLQCQGPSSSDGVDVQNGTLSCLKGHAYPIVNGVPCLLAGAGDDAAAIAESFGREWSHFQYEQDRTWAQETESRCQLFLKEMDIDAQNLQGKLVLDAGCGNGSLSFGLTRLGCQVLAADVSPSVHAAHRYYAAKANQRAHFVQADLMQHPFRPGTFDVVYCSGVLHHNPNTRDALRSISTALAPGGKIYVWLYGKEPGIVHQLKELFRRTISPLPAWLKHAIVCLWLPQAMLRQHVRTLLRINNPEDRLKWRERLVLLLDHYTPRYRWEHTPQELTDWYRELGYVDIKVTEIRQWGFGVVARRPDSHQSAP